MAATFAQGYRRFAAITTSDTVDLPGGVSDAILVGGAGIVQAVSESGTVVAMTLPVGIHQLRLRRVNATSTSATLLVALYHA
jgi:hypothetical protein